jgi:hypothetical protein
MCNFGFRPKPKINIKTILIPNIAGQIRILYLPNTNLERYRSVGKALWVFSFLCPERVMGPIRLEICATLSCDSSVSPPSEFIYSPVFGYHIVRDLLLLFKKNYEVQMLFIIELNLIITARHLKDISWPILR